MRKITSVRLREFGKTQPFYSYDMPVKVGDHVIVEADRGLDYGDVLNNLMAVADDKVDKSIKKILRVADPKDLETIKENKKKSRQACNTCIKKVEEHKLDMKLVAAEYSFDASKIIFYFTSEGRVDFRNLVKDLAHIFKARIEMRQIGVRDEAKLFGGIGPCGKKLCCASFLKDFEPVTVKMAKDQNLPLNPPKLSGLCGRLMCCLSYEHKTYKMLNKGLPSEGEKIHTPEGKGKVINVNILKRCAIVELEDGRHVAVRYKDIQEK